MTHIDPRDDKNALALEAISAAVRARADDPAGVLAVLQEHATTDNEWRDRELRNHWANCVARSARECTVPLLRSVLRHGTDRELLQTLVANPYVSAEHVAWLLTTLFARGVPGDTLHLMSIAARRWALALSNIHAAECERARPGSTGPTRDAWRWHTRVEQCVDRVLEAGIQARQSNQSANDQRVAMSETLTAMDREAWNAVDIEYRTAGADYRVTDEAGFYCALHPLTEPALLREMYRAWPTDDLLMGVMRRKERQEDMLASLAVRPLFLDLAKRYPPAVRPLLATADGTPEELRDIWAALAHTADELDHWLFRLVSDPSISDAAIGCMPTEWQARLACSPASQIRARIVVAQGATALASGASVTAAAAPVINAPPRSASRPAQR